MKISTKGRYGLRAMIDLAVYSNGGHVSLNSIAERQGISIIYLEQVFAILRKAELVKSVKGAQGGYTLIDKPSNLNIGTILRILEGQLSVIDKSNDDIIRKETRIQKCLRRNVWDRMNDCLNDILYSITLEDMANDYKKANGIYVSMYYI